MLKNIAIQKEDLVRKVIALSWFTVGYNLIEGTVSIFFGISDGSVSLAGFGVDSLIEVGSACVVLWRFRGESGNAIELAVEKERRATFTIGILFLLLAVATTAASILHLKSGTHPETTLPGFVISAISLSFMFYLYFAKKKLAHQLDSHTVEKDADCSMACIKLSIILCLGSIVFLVFPTIWWADAASGLLLSYFIGREGWETVQNARKPDFEGGCGCAN